MIVQKQFLEKIKKYFSLNIYEVKIWTALLSRGIASAGELSEVSNVPRSRSYDVLESLEKKGFVIMKIGRPIKYIAVQPEEIVTRIRKNVSNEIQKDLEIVDKLKETNVFKELELLHKQGVEHVDASELTGSMIGRKKLYAQLESMLKGAKESVLIVTTSKGLTRKYNALKNTLKKLNKRGVKVTVAAPLNKDTKKTEKLLANIAEVKHVDKLKARFAIVDDKEMIFMTSDDKVQPGYDSGVWVDSPFFTQAVKGMFEF